MDREHSEQRPQPNPAEKPSTPVPARVISRGLQPSISRDNTTHRQDQIRSELRDEGTPAWARQEVSLRDLDLRRILPFGLIPLQELSKWISSLRGEDSYTSLSLDRIRAFMPSGEAAVAVPLMASILAHASNPDIPIASPNSSEVRAMISWVRPDLGRWAWFASLVPKGERLINKKVMSIMHKKADEVIKAVEMIGNIPNPKKQFIQEVIQLYWHLLGRRNEEVSLEDRISDLMYDLRSIRDGYDNPRFPRQRYPLLTVILPVLKFPKDKMMLKVEGISIAGSIAGRELMGGILSFLHGQRLNIPPPPPGYSLLNEHSWKRAAAELFAGHRFKQVRFAIPYILHWAMEALPNSGPDFRRRFYDYARKIVAAKAQGKTDIKIADAVFPR